MILSEEEYTNQSVDPYSTAVHVSKPGDTIKHINNRRSWLTRYKPHKT